MRAGVSNWAETGNGEDIPNTKLNQVRRMINLGGFPAGSIEAIPNGGQQQFFLAMAYRNKQTKTP